MPQMAPLNWYILFIMFNMIMIIIISVNYYMMLPFISKKKTPKKNFYFWMW